MLPQTPPPAATAPRELAHTVSSFEFFIDAPMSKAAPLFGPEGERRWSGKEWDPQFLYPHKPQDVEGAVFTIRHGGSPSTWVNTRFDLADGRMQYVVIAPGAMVTVIDVALTPQGARTRAHVTYTRTALSSEASEHVLALSRADQAKGPEWEAAIAAALKPGL